MTKKQLRRAVVLVIASYAALGLIAFTLHLLSPSIGNAWVGAYQVAVPFIFAIPAALLGYAFQQRGSYLFSLRALWSRLVQSVNAAIHYTFDSEPTQVKHAEVLAQLAVAIDEVRGVYCNVDERDDSLGLYPYEPVKEIYAVVLALGHGPLADEKRKHAREHIIRNWQSIRRAFLAEFDRAEPSEPITKPKST